jgi:hypothetical protein
MSEGESEGEGEGEDEGEGDSYFYYLSFPILLSFNICIILVFDIFTFDQSSENHFFSI